MLLQKSDRKGQLISIQPAMTVNVVVDSECVDGFEILKVWQNLAVLKRNKVQAIHKTGEMTGPVQRTVKNDIDDLKLIEVDNSPHVHESN